MRKGQEGRPRSLLLRRAAMNASFRLSNSFMRCNDSSAESFRRLGRPSFAAGFTFFFDTTSLLRESNVPSRIVMVTYPALLGQPNSAAQHTHRLLYPDAI